jgi:hypothetical protein
MGLVGPPGLTHKSVRGVREGRAPKHLALAAPEA